MHLERGDFATAITNLESEISNGKGQRRPNSYKLDLTECVVRQGNLKIASNKLQCVEISKLKGEEKHRFRHMKTLIELGGTSWMDFGLVDGELQSDDIKINAEEARNEARKGFEGVRGHGAMPAAALEGMIVSAGSPGGAYLPYRSVFRILTGRAIVARLLTSKVGTASLTEDLATLRTAMREFDQGKGGLNTRLVLLRGWADLHAAESTLFFVRRTFDRTSDRTEDPNRLGVIEAKLRSCRTQLRNALASLQSGRRNALWWRHYYRLYAQYHTEKLFVDLCRLDNHPISSANGSDRRFDSGIDLVRRYTKALEAIATFADYSLIRAEAIKSPWLLRTLGEIHLGVTVAIATYEIIESQSETIYCQLVKDTLWLLNTERSASAHLVADNNQVIEATKLLANTVSAISLDRALSKLQEIDFLKIITSLLKYSETVSSYQVC